MPEELAAIVLDPIGAFGDLRVEGHANGDYTYVEMLGLFTRRTYVVRQEPLPHPQFRNQHGVVYDPKNPKTWGGNARPDDAPGQP